MSQTFCMGNQAIAYGALRSGVDVVCGYPGTPSSEILQTVANEVKCRQLKNTYVEWSVNEKAALEIAAGASYGGARALVTMKQVGLNVASDALMSLPYLGIKGGLVLVVADDPGPISSQTEQDTRQFAAFAKVPVFDPSTPEEAYLMIQEAFELSERHTTPVIVRPTTRICHGSAAINISLASSESPENKTLGFDRNRDWVIFPKRTYLGHLEIWQRLSQIAKEFDISQFNAIKDTHQSAPSHLGIVAGGISYAYLNDALLGLKNVGAIRLLKIGTPHPFPEDLALQFMEGLSEVLILEELEPVIERELLMLVGKHKLKAKIQGKLTKHATLAGENSIAEITKQVRKFCDLDFFDRGFDKPVAIKGNLEAHAIPELPMRPPVLCAGCPHRASFYAVKRALKGRKAVFSGDIGCYTLGNAAPLNMVDTCLCMGAGFTIPQGLDRVEPDVLHFGFVGDSTFFASGLTGVANAVYNQSNVVLCVLDNSTTAMTGSQPHPGTGMRIGLDSSARDAENALRIPDILKALGVKNVAVVDPFDEDSAVDAVVKAADDPKVSAIVFKSPCITVVKPKSQPHIDANICTNCKLCVREIGCPALIEVNGKIAIDDALCYGCNLCVARCPFDAIRATNQLSGITVTDTKPSSLNSQGSTLEGGTDD